MDRKTVTLRCDCGAEAAVFSKYIFKNEVDYGLSFEDSWLAGNTYKGFFGRIKRAWKAFIAKPVSYTDVYCEGKDKMREFLVDCLALIDEEDSNED
jgi:hypothetical protein